MAVSLDLKPQDKSTWPNDCRRCNYLDLDQKHSPNSCCIVCRNYSAIDRVAQEWSFKLDSTWTGQSGKSAHEILRGYNKQVEEQQKQLETARKAQNQAVKDYNDYYNGAVKSSSTAYEKARKDYEAAYAVYLDAFNAMQASKTTATTAAHDKAKAEMNRLKAISEKAAIPLQTSNTQLTTLEQKHADAKADFDERAFKVKQAVSKANEMIEHIARWLLGRTTKDVPKDPISRARFFFVWVATSIRYELKAHTTDLNLRQPIHTLANGYEVCRGYAELFDLLFNTSFTVGETVAESDKSIYISGHAKQGSQAQGPVDEGANLNAHGWNAFPTGAVDGSKKPIYKLIDCTWGAGHVDDKANSAPYDPTWFTKSNEEFLRNHIPRKDEEQFVHSIMAKGVFWKQDLADFYSNSDRFHLDKTSVKPANSSIDWKLQTFEWRKCCPHYHDTSMPGFALYVDKSDSGNAPLEPKNFVWFKAPAAGSVGSWTAQINLAAKEYAGMNEVKMVGFFEKVSVGSGSNSSAAPVSTPVRFANVQELDNFVKSEKHLEIPTVVIWKKK